MPTPPAVTVPDRPAPARVVAAGSLALSVTVVPAFLTGALSRRIGDDLGFGAGAAGAAVAAFFVGAGLLAVPMGRVTERIGPALALRAGTALSGACAALVAVAVHGWWQLCLALFVAGSAVGLVDTGAARAFGDVVPDGRHGSAFGVKEASVPAASLLAGVSIPVLVDAIGWRPAFALGAALVPLVWAVVPALPARHMPTGGDAGGRAPAAFVLFAVGVGLGCGAATAAGTLLVPAIEDRGWAEGDAGLLLAAVSVASIAVRVAAGRRSDTRPGGAWRELTALLAVGAAGALLLAASDAGAAGVVGALAVIGGGWGWTGLAYLTAVRVGGQRPAAAASVVLTGLSVGGAAGPAAFGAIASASSYRAAWLAATVALVLGAAAIAAARRRLDPPRARSQHPG
jgi:predicted MFS family arabinose efflux permease